MRILGIDLGSKTVGMAICDYLEIIASPIGTKTIEENNLQEALECVKMVVKERQVEKIVLGLPKNMDGSQGFQSEYCLKFKEMLEKEFSFQIVHSAMRDTNMRKDKRKDKVDTIAASIILQSYLDTKK